VLNNAPKPKVEPDPRYVVTPLQPDALSSLLKALNIFKKWEWVIRGIEHGFDVGIKTPVSKTIILPNHSSTNKDPSFIDDYIYSEEQAGRYSQPYCPAQLEAIIGPFRTSPLGLVPKPGSDKPRLIQDLSFPRNDPDLPSVNSGIDASQFPTEWGTFDETAAMIAHLPPGCMAATFDISAAYRTTPVRPDQQNHLCIMWRGQVRVDRAVCFGMASSAGVFGSIGDLICAIVRAKEWGPLKQWVDDFFVVRTPFQTWTEQDFISLTASFGVPWNLVKTRPFAVRQKYIGFVWDLLKLTVSLPDDKREAALTLIAKWLSPQSRFTQADTVSFHGKMIRISCIFPLIRPFLKSITTFSSSFRSQHAKLHPPCELADDLTWIRYLVLSLPNEVPVSLPEPYDIGWWGDASSSWGIGIIVGKFWTAFKWCDGFTVGPHHKYDISWAETVAVDLGFRLAEAAGTISALPPNRRHLLIRSDNTGVCGVLHRGRARNGHTNRVLKLIYKFLAHHLLTATAEHVSSCDNISDALSRGDIAGFLHSFPHVTSHLPISIPPYLVHKLHLYLYL
jgi:hypothetical protein